MGAGWVVSYLGIPTAVVTAVGGPIGAGLVILFESIIVGNGAYWVTDVVLDSIDSE